MSKLLFVVHRYYPFEGGSERNVKHMAEECVRRGHEVWVLSGEHQGDQNGVRLTNDVNVLSKIWDLIIVHGSCPTQDVVLANSDRLISPILYLIIQPNDSPVIEKGIRCCDYIGYGTSFDFKHIAKYNQLSKAREVNYGIPCGEYEYKFATIEDEDKFRSLIKVAPDARMILSVGGWWPHKQMEQIVDAFKEANVPNAHLVLCGYDSRAGNNPPQNAAGCDNISLVANATHEQIMMLMATADLYVMNSDSEGFGLVLLEAMVNKTPWVARNIAGAHDMKDYGVAYDTYEELVNCLKPDFTEHYTELLASNSKIGYEYTLRYRSITNMIDDIEKVLQEAGYDRAEYSNTPR